MGAKREELTPAYATITTSEVDIGSEVAANQRRYIYSIKTVNLHTADNTLTLRKNSTDIDTIEHVTAGLTIKDPEDPKEDSLPIYILDAEEQLAAQCDNGNCWVRILFVDAE